MKIAFIIPSLRNLGPIIVVNDLISRLKENYDIEINVFYFDEFDDELINFNVKCEKIKFFGFYDFSSYDVVHSHGFRPDIYTFFNNTCLLKVSTQHNIIFEEYIVNYSYIKTKFIEKLWILSLFNKDKIVAIGDTAKNYYEKFYSNGNKVINIPNGRNICNSGGVSHSDLKLIQHLKNNYICLGSCTRAIKRKGHKQILQALVNLPNYCFILVGDGDYLDDLKKFAQDLNVDNRCLFLGYRENATDYLQYFDIFVQSSYAESISIALLEAAAARKAIICSDIPVNHDIFSEKEVQFFKLDSIDSLSNAINKISKSIYKYEELAFMKYKNEFTSEAMALKYYNTYKDLINVI